VRRPPDDLRSTVSAARDFAGVGVDGRLGVRPILVQPAGAFEDGCRSSGQCLVTPVDACAERIAVAGSAETVEHGPDLVQRTTLCRSR
jgi:hypothetical protein